MVNATNSTYNLMPSSQQDTVYGLLSTINDITGGYFFTGILLTTFIIFLLAGDRTENGLFASAFITTILAVFFAALNLINLSFVVLIVAGFSILFVYRMLRRE